VHERFAADNTIGKRVESIGNPHFWRALAIAATLTVGYG